MNSAETCSGLEGPTDRAAPRDAAASPKPVSAHAKADTKPSERRREGDARFSPDPMSQTDRYRLVTPFSLRP